MVPMLASPLPNVAAYFTWLMVWVITWVAPARGVACSSNVSAASRISAS